MSKKYLQTILQVFVILSVVLSSIVPTSQVDAQVNTNPTKESIGKGIPSSNVSFLSLNLLERPNAVKGERPNLSENLQEPYRTIVCVANCSNTTPGVTVSQTWSEVGEHKTFFFKVLCPDWGCSKVDVYYTATLAVDWAVFIPWTSYARIGAGTLFGGGTGETGHLQCGASNVNSSSCTISTSGVIPAEIMNADPSAGYHGWHFNINSWGGPGAAWQYAHTTFTVTASLDPNFLSGNAEAYCNDPCGDNSEGASQGYVADPINTNTGAFFYPIDGLSFPNSPELDFKYTYLSAAKDKYTSPMGYGWTHNKDIRLIFSNQPEGVSGSVLFKHPSGNLYKFFDSGYGRYEPYGGLTSKLVRNNSSPITYTLTDQRQNVYLFDENGVLLTYTTADGKILNYEYDTGGKLVQVNVDNETHYINFTYDTNDRLISVTDHANRSVLFEYDSSGDLISTTDVLGEEWTYEYDTDHFMLEVIDPNQVTKVRNAYSDGKVIQQFNGEDELVVGLTYTTDQNENKVTLVEDALGNETVHQYDSRETLVTQTNALSLDIEKTYDNKFRPSAIVDANGNSTALTWSADGANLLRVIDAEGGQTDITYNTLNLPTSVIDPRGHLTTYEYDGVLLTSNTNALNQETTYTYTPEGYLESVTDPLGNTTSYTYDSYGQKTSMTDPLGNTWTYTYDSLGRLVDTTDPLGHVTHNEYDLAGRLIKVTQNYDPNKTQNEDAVWNIVTEYAYDVRGNQISVTDTFGRVTQFEYDSADRLIKTTDPAGNESINTYNSAGQLIATTDALGRTTEYQYDAAGRLISTTDALGNVTSTAYNPDGTVLSTTDALGRTTSYLYDDVKRVTTVTLPNGSQTHNTYDESGNLLTTTEHPFYVETKGWTDAEDLQLGDEVRNADGETGEVEFIEFEQTSQEMYNLTVDEAHTFFVGDGQWLVHNACDFHRIPYGSDELSRAVQQFRIDWNLPGKNTNVAVFNMNGHLPSKLINDIYAYPEILRLDGNLIIAKNIEGGPHSEDIILQLLKSNNVNRVQVMSVYSELSPCIGCSNKLNNFSKYGSDLPVAFSFMYPSEVYLKYKAVEILLKRKYTGVILP